MLFLLYVGFAKYERKQDFSGVIIKSRILSLDFITIEEPPFDSIVWWSSYQQQQLFCSSASGTINEDLHDCVRTYYETEEGKGDNVKVIDKGDDCQSEEE